MFRLIGKKEFFDYSRDVVGGYEVISNIMMNLSKFTNIEGTSKYSYFKDKFYLMKDNVLSRDEVVSLLSDYLKNSNLNIPSVFLNDELDKNDPNYYLILSNCIIDSYNQYISSLFETKNFKVENMDSLEKRLNYLLSYDSSNSSKINFLRSQISEEERDYKNITMSLDYISGLFPKEFYDYMRFCDFEEDFIRYCASEGLYLNSIYDIENYYDDNKLKIKMILPKLLCKIEDINNYSRLNNEEIDQDVKEKSESIMKVADIFSVKSGDSFFDISFDKKK